MEEQWTNVGKMSHPRSGSGVAVVNFSDYRKYCLYDNDYESHVQDLSRKENEHEASSENVELDDNCLKRTRPIMSNIMDKIEEMKDCFLKPRGSIATMTIGSMSPCTARLEETVLKALYHDPGESQEGHLIIALLFDCDVYFSRAYHWRQWSWFPVSGDLPS